MNSTYFMLVAGSTVVSLAVAYAGWTYLRVIMMKNDILKTKLELLRKAKKLGLKDDPAHIAMQTSLDTMYEHVDLFGTQLLFYGIARKESGKSPILIESIDNEFNKYLDYVRMYTGNRIVRYILFQTISGLILYSMAATMPLRMKLNLVQKSLGFMDSFTDRLAHC
ncbi:hypothetical protein [Singulisphaera sp. PoT]|uniref:hypothetical protein n=1 Tax=Singulisphaera sp. PoT TaxID=3411797 RepID=UPI003BF57D88